MSVDICDNIVKCGKRKFEKEVKYRVLCLPRRNSFSSRDITREFYYLVLYIFIYRLKLTPSSKIY